MAKISSDERRWRAESDADTMMRYQEIMADRTRMNAAIKMAQSKAKELNSRASAMSRVASTKPSRKK